MPGPESGLTDDELLSRTAAGERGAFDAIVARHRAAVYRLARAATRNDAAAEDVLQESFLSAYRAAGSHRGDASVRTWLLRIARNAAFHHRRKEGRHDPGELALWELGARAGWGSEDPEAIARRAERRDVLEAALWALSPEDREVIVLRDLEELSGEATAEALGLALPAMKSRLHRASAPRGRASGGRFRCGPMIAGSERCAARRCSIA